MKNTNTLPSNWSQVIGEATATYSPLKKTLEKQTEKQINALKSLNLSNETDELKRIESIFPKNLLIDLTKDKELEIFKLFK